MRDRRERRDGEGRHVLPAHRQEAPPRTGGRAAERAPVHLSGGFRRRLPADAGRGLSGPRALRAHLLQSGGDVRRGDSADRGGHGLLHSRRRLRPGHERRDGDRQGHGHDLSRRPAAREGGHRRGGDRGGARRRRRPHAHLRRGRPLRRLGRARARPRPRDRREPEPARSRSSVGTRGAGRAAPRPGRPLRDRPRRLREGLRRPRGHRPHRRRQRLPRVQGALRRDPRLRVRPHRGLPGRDSRQRTACSSPRAR